MHTEISFPNLGIYLKNVGKSIDLFGIEIAYYGIIIGTAILLGFWIAAREAKRTGQNPENYLDMGIIGVIAGIVGARLYYVIFSWDMYKDNLLDIFNLREGGLAIYGGVIAAVISVLVLAKVKHLSAPQIFDTIAMALLNGQMLGRWGNFFNREAFGEYTDSLFAMGLPMDSVQKSAVTKLMKQHLVTFRDMDYIQVHPLFFYESIWCLLLLLILLLYTWRKKFEGEIFLRYLAGYGLGKCVIEWLRTDKLYIPKTKIPVSLLVSAALFLICGIVATVRRILSKKREKVSRRRREERNAAEEKNDGSRLEDIHNFENVQDEFRDILEELDRAGKMVAEENTESNESEDSKSAETAETTETEVSESVEDAEAAEAPASAETVESENKGTEGSAESAEAEPEAGPDDREDV